MHNKKYKNVSGSIAIEVILASFMFLGISNMLYKTLQVSHKYVEFTKQNNLNFILKNSLITKIKIDCKIPEIFNGFKINANPSMNRLYIQDCSEYFWDLDYTVCEILIPNKENIIIKYRDLFNVCNNQL